MKEFIGQNVLITTQNWFYGTDGKAYRGAWGTLKGVHKAEDTMGIVPNRSHANWFIEIGDMIVMGCQVLYITKCKNPPPPESIKDHATSSGDLKEFIRPGEIFIMD